MQKKINRRNLIRKQSQGNSTKSVMLLKSTTEQSGQTTNQITNSTGQITNEAIDVLSFMGFKL